MEPHFNFWKSSLSCRKPLRQMTSFLMVFYHLLFPHLNASHFALPKLGCSKGFFPGALPHSYTRGGSGGWWSDGLTPSSQQGKKKGPSPSAAVFALQDLPR